MTSRDDLEEHEIGFFAVDGAIPLNFYPLPMPDERDDNGTEADESLDRAVASGRAWLRRGRERLDQGTASVWRKARPEPATTISSATRRAR